MHVVNNKHIFTKNLEVYNHDTRSAKNFHLPITNLTVYQKGACYTGVKIFNYLPTHIKNVTNERQVFKKTLKRFLLDNSFYSTDENFNVINDIHS
jgi:NADPH-dependent glutamate synthase beta subunit-like oxidoreductase